MDKLNDKPALTSHMV